MALSGILKMIKSPFAMMLTLAIVSMICPAEAAVTCDSSSYQCCWVRRIWELLGRTTSVSSTSSTACCSYLGSTTQTSAIPGVNCTSDGTVIQIVWTNRSPKLSGPLPPEIGNLVNLQIL